MVLTVVGVGTDRVAISHDAQPCYCGEPNCVGFIGGKTQTDIAAMDDLYLDGTFMQYCFLNCRLDSLRCSARYIRGSCRVGSEGQQEAKEQKTRRRLHRTFHHLSCVRINVELALESNQQPTLKPLIEKDIPKVIQALRQTLSRKVLIKLLMRIKVSQPARRRRMH